MATAARTTKTTATRTMAAVPTSTGRGRRPAVAETAAQAARKATGRAKAPVAKTLTRGQTASRASKPSMSGPATVSRRGRKPKAIMPMPVSHEDEMMHEEDTFEHHHTDMHHDEHDEEQDEHDEFDEDHDDNEA